MSYSKEIDKKWQKIWKDTSLYKFNNKELDNKFYNLEMFSYPSGAKLHLGHWFNFGPTDSYARFKHMKGFNVFHPMGFDAFGLPAENYAIKTGIHPKDSTFKNIETMKTQLEEMGATYDWNYSVETCNPNYYKWTQWIFQQLYKAGLAYKKKAPVNWCPSCSTVLANEQVENGTCERCKSLVERKKLEQWFFKTTSYAQQLLDDLEKIDWPESTKKVQQNWIGRSEGAEVKFKVENSDIEFTVYTTRPDTLFGVTYVVLAPESEIVDKIVLKEYREAIEAYRKQTLLVTEIERMSTDREKTGTFTGAYAVNPVNGERVPVWIADYVLEEYGTGCVMAVPAHDERDFEFATKYELPIKQVIKDVGTETVLPYTNTESGVLLNSKFLDNLSVTEAKKAIIDYLEKENIGTRKINYKLKDWLVSRQRYWGAPIPVINCEHCGEVLVPEEDLPVLLPYNVEFKPDGESPLKKSEEFMNVTCPKCGKPAKREADTLDTFVCSSWYFLRYPDANNNDKAWDVELINKMLPVDIYVGGKEHAAMHLIYARFMTKALRDMGYLNFDEPFKKLVHQGMILGPDGNKMSKSKGNTVAPDPYIDEYGADVFRMYLMFGFAYTVGGPWKDEGIKAMSKFVNRIETLIDKVQASKYQETTEIGNKEKELIYHKNRVIKAMGEDLEDFGFNTAIARSMELLNEITNYEQTEIINIEILNDCVKTLVILLSPLAPHFTEEMWEKLGNSNSIYNEKWPEYNEDEMQLDEMEIPVQINGKVRIVLKVSKDIKEQDLKELVNNNENISALLEGKTIVKEIYVKGKIYNIVVK